MSATGEGRLLTAEGKRKGWRKEKEWKEDKGEVRGETEEEEDEEDRATSGDTKGKRSEQTMPSKIDTREQV